MQKISTRADFDSCFPHVRRKHFARTQKHIVNRMRKALDSYHMAAQTRRDIRGQLGALAILRDCAAEYVEKKADKKNSNPKKHQFVSDLHAACETLIGEIHSHAQRALQRLQAPHHSVALPVTARHTAQRISTGVNLKPEYRLEQFTAKYGPNRRVHAGDFLTDAGRHGQDLGAMNHLELYALIKDFKHMYHHAPHLQYFNNPARAAKKLTLGHGGTVMLNGQLASTTTGSFEEIEFNAFRDAYTPTGVHYPQSSGGEEGEAIYVCDIDGDFYVHLDTDKHAGRYQHSSLLAGQEVTCAGTIYIVAGRVVMLSNNSGHYQPSALDLHDAMVAMEEDLDVDPKTVMIVCMSNNRRYFCSGQALLTITPQSGIEGLPQNVCISWDTDPSEVIRNLSTAALHALTLAEAFDQQNVVSALRRQAALAWGAGTLKQQRITASRIGSARGGI
ncbi:hypothetical protein PQR75_41385 [Paraburkholderia fungorum]|uniref:hypothetical protein n=1 Tax=Paraburkholderia fungorum TaxID=134537 RepID=UPI0038BC3A36